MIDAFRREVVRDNRDVHDDGIAEQMPSAERTETEFERRDETEQARGALS